MSYNVEVRAIYRWIRGRTWRVVACAVAVPMLVVAAMLLYVVETKQVRLLLANSCEWNHRGDQLAVAYINGSVEILSYDGTRLVSCRTLRPGTKDDKKFYYYYMKWSPDDSMLAMGATGDKVVLNIKDGRELLAIAEPFRKPDNQVGGPGEKMAWSPDSRKLAEMITTSESYLSIWEIEGSTETRIPTNWTDATNGYSAGIRSVEWSPDGRILAIQGAYESGLYVVDLATSRHMTAPPGTTSLILSDGLNCAFSPDGTQIAFCRKRQQVEKDSEGKDRADWVAAIYSLPSLTEVRKISIETGRERWMTACDPRISWSADGKRLAVSYTLDAQNRSALSGLFSADFDMNSDARVCWIDVASGKPLGSLTTTAGHMITIPVIRFGFYYASDRPLLTPKQDKMAIVHQWSLRNSEGAVSIVEVVPAPALTTAATTK